MAGWRRRLRGHPHWGLAVTSVRLGDNVDPSLERILTSMERKLDTLDEKVDRIAENSMSRAEFNAFQDIRRSNIRWSVGTMISVVIVALSALAFLVGQL